MWGGPIPGSFSRIFPDFPGLFELQLTLLQSTNYHTFYWPLGIGLLHAFQWREPMKKWTTVSVCGLICLALVALVSCDLGDLFYQLPTYTVTYMATNAGSGAAPLLENYVVGTSVTIKGNSGALAKEGYTFDGWDSERGGDGNRYSGGDTILMPAYNLFLYAQWRPYRVGDIGPAGGLIFYDDEADDVDDIPDVRYLEAAPVEAESGSMMFGYYRTNPNGAALLIDGTSPDFGTGKANTDRLVTAMGTTAYFSSNSNNQSTTDQYAAAYCANLVHGGKTDWFLPSTEELILMFENLEDSAFGNFSDAAYWSSTEKSASVAKRVLFSEGNHSSSDASKDTNYHVRPIRAF
jgi:uncharacterized repeat protein (TIGR02543 family)